MYKRPRIEWTGDKGWVCGGEAAAAAAVAADLDARALAARGVRWLSDATAVRPAAPMSSESAPVAAYNVATYLRLCLGRLSDYASSGRLLSPLLDAETRPANGADSDKPQPDTLLDAFPAPLASLAMLWPPPRLYASMMPDTSGTCGAPATPSRPRPVPLRHVTQHVSYMLGRSGRGPGIQYAFLGGPFHRPTELRDALQGSCYDGGSLSGFGGFDTAIADSTTPGACSSEAAKGEGARAEVSRFLDEELGTGKPAASVPVAEVAECMVRLAGVVSFVLPVTGVDHGPTASEYGVAAVTGAASVSAELP